MSKYAKVSVVDAGKLSRAGMVATPKAMQVRSLAHSIGQIRLDIKRHAAAENWPKVDRLAALLLAQGQRLAVLQDALAREGNETVAG